VERAVAIGLRALAITDHDTFAAYPEATPAARQLGLELVPGVEISTREQGKSVHLLAYWPDSFPPESFLTWLNSMLEIRRERNRRLSARLLELQIPVSLEEAEALGRTVTGRVHFAKVLIAKGFAQSINEAFDRYIGEDAPGYVEMEDPKTDAAVRKVREEGGIPVLAHPVRLGMRYAEKEEEFIRRQVDAGLLGLEVMHSDHNEELRERYSRLTQKYGLLRTGGSDYHGSVNPKISLGSGANGNVAVPEEWLELMKSQVIR
jgi:predicted metal-dependent phosphoesterase TrpH